MSVIATTTLDNDEDLTLSRKLWERVRDKGFEGADEDSQISSEEEEGKAQREASDFSSEDEAEEESDSGDSMDEKEVRVAAMADQMEHQLSSVKEYQMTVDRKMAGREAKKK